MRFLSFSIYSYSSRLRSFSSSSFYFNISSCSNFSAASIFYISALRSSSAFCFYSSANLCYSASSSRRLYSYSNSRRFYSSCYFYSASCYILLYSSIDRSASAKRASSSCCRIKAYFSSSCCFSFLIRSYSS